MFLDFIDYLPSETLLISLIEGLTHYVPSFSHHFLFAQRSQLSLILANHFCDILGQFLLWLNCESLLKPR